MSYNYNVASGLQKIAFRELMKGVCTSIPGHVLALYMNGSQQKAQVQVGVERVDINGASFQLRPIEDVPVHFPGGDFCVEYQIDPGCEGMIFFSQRCVDGWKNTGGIAQNPLGRFHELQDAFFVPGFRSLPNVLPDFQNNGIRLRNRSGSQYAWLKNDGSIDINNGAGRVNIGSDGSIESSNGAGKYTLMANGTVDINGVKITPEGRITPPPGGGITGANGVDYESHRHTGVQPGVGTSGGPV